MRENNNTVPKPVLLPSHFFRMFKINHVFLSFYGTIQVKMKWRHRRPGFQPLFPGRSLGRCVRSWAALGAYVSDLGPLLSPCLLPPGRSCAALGSLLGRSWPILGHSWDALGLLLAALGALLCVWGAPGTPKMFTQRVLYN